MKGLCGLLVLLCLLCGCQGEEQPDGNLVVTNYTDNSISCITVTRQGAEIASSEGPLGDTQMCWFTIEPEEDCAYGLSFLDSQGEEHGWELVDSFSEEETVFLAVRYENGNWMLGHDT